MPKPDCPGRERHCNHYEEGDGHCCLCGAKLPDCCEQCGGLPVDFDDTFELCTCIPPLRMANASVQP